MEETETAAAAEALIYRSRRARRWWAEGLFDQDPSKYAPELNNIEGCLARISKRIIWPTGRGGS